MLVKVQVVARLIAGAANATGALEARAFLFLSIVDLEIIFSILLHFKQHLRDVVLVQSLIIVSQTTKHHFEAAFYVIFPNVLLVVHGAWDDSVLESGE